MKLHPVGLYVHAPTLAATRVQQSNAVQGWSAWLLFGLFLAIALSADAQISPEPTDQRLAHPVSSQVAPAAPKVIRLDGRLELDYSIEVVVDHLGGWAEAQDVRRLVPFIDGRPIRSNYPEGIDLDHGRLLFHLEITPESEGTWALLLGAPDGLRRPVTFSVGLEDGSPFDSVYGRDNRVLLTVISPAYGLIALLVVLATLILFVQLARTTSIIREPGPNPDRDQLRPYDLGRFQMALWFFLVYVSYTAIWLITDATDTINPSLLALMGISAGTALSATMIDAGRDSAMDDKRLALAAEQQALAETIADLHAGQDAIDAAGPDAIDSAAVTDGHRERLRAGKARLMQIEQQLNAMQTTAFAEVSRGFLRDLLADANGYRFDRFQIFAFTMILGVVFVSAVYNGLAMPELDPTLLALMGLSSGTYIGFKFPEHK